MPLNDDPAVVAQRFRQMAAAGVISAKSADKLANRSAKANQTKKPPAPRQEGVRQYAKGEPLHLILLLDVSGSMTPISRHLASAQRDCINALRGSNAALNGRLFIKQYFVGSTYQEWHAFERLGTDGKGDGVGMLPQDFDIASPPRSISLPGAARTALFSAMKDALEAMVEEFWQIRKDGRNTSFYLGVVTDGRDNVGGCSPDDLKFLQSNYREDLSDALPNPRTPILNRSVLISLTSPDGLSASDANNLADELGVDQHLLATKDEASIRRAFLIMSKVIK